MEEEEQMRRRRGGGGDGGKGEEKKRRRRRRGRMRGRRTRRRKTMGQEEEEEGEGFTQVFQRIKNVKKKVSTPHSWSRSWKRYLKSCAFAHLWPSFVETVRLDPASTFSKKNKKRLQENGDDNCRVSFFSF